MIRAALCVRPPRKAHAKQAKSVRTSTTEATTIICPRMNELAVATRSTWSVVAACPRDVSLIRQVRGEVTRIAVGDTCARADTRFADTPRPTTGRSPVRWLACSSCTDGTGTTSGRSAAACVGRARCPFEADARSDTTSVTPFATSACCAGTGSVGTAAGAADNRAAGWGADAGAAGAAAARTAGVGAGAVTGAGPDRAGRRDSGST